MKKSHYFALALVAMPLLAQAVDQDPWYVAGGVSKGGGNFSIGAGSNVDVLELSLINLGSVSGDASAKFRGISLVQHAVPTHDFNLLFRLGVGKTTTSFANGASSTRMGFSNGIILGLGGQYQLNRHFAFRGELNRIPYAASADGLSYGVTYPATLSALYSF